MKLKSVFIILSGLFIVQMELNAKEVLATCMHNEANYMALLATWPEFPEVFKGLESKSESNPNPNRKLLYRLSGVKRAVANAALKLRIDDNGNFVMAANVLAPNTIDPNGKEVVVTQICIKDKELTVDLENKQTYKGEVSGSSFTLNKGTFKTTTEIEYAAEVEKIKAAYEPAPATDTVKPLSEPPFKNESGKK